MKMLSSQQKKVKKIKMYTHQYYMINNCLPHAFVVDQKWDVVWRNSQITRMNIEEDYLSWLGIKNKQEQLISKIPVEPKVSLSLYPISFLKLYIKPFHNYYYFVLYQNYQQFIIQSILSLLNKNKIGISQLDFLYNIGQKIMLKQILKFILVKKGYINKKNQQNQIKEMLFSLVTLLFLQINQMGRQIKFKSDQKLRRNRIEFSRYITRQQYIMLTYYTILYFCSFEQINTVKIQNKITEKEGAMIFKLNKGIKKKIMIRQNLEIDFKQKSVCKILFLYLINTIKCNVELLQNQENCTLKILLPWKRNKKKIEILFNIDLLIKKYLKQLSSSLINIEKCDKKFWQNFINQISIKYLTKKNSVLIQNMDEKDEIVQEIKNMNFLNYCKVTKFVFSLSLIKKINGQEYLQSENILYKKPLVIQNNCTLSIKSQISCSEEEARPQLKPCKIQKNLNFSYFDLIYYNELNFDKQISEINVGQILNLFKENLEVVKYEHQLVSNFQLISSKLGYEIYKRRQQQQQQQFKKKQQNQE